MEWPCAVVDHDDVDAGIDQQLGAVQPVVADAGRRSGAQAALLVLAGAGELVGLLDVLDGDQADAAVVGIDHHQLLDAPLVQELLGFLGAHALTHRHQLLAGHQRIDRRRVVRRETHVSVGQDAGELAVRLHDRDARDLVLDHQGQRIGQRLLGMDGDGVHHHARFEFLDLAHLVGLLFGRKVLVDDADGAGLRHGDRHWRLGDRIHRRRQQRNIELDGAGEPGARVGLVGQDGRRRRLQEDVIEGERFLKLHANLREGVNENGGPCSGPPGWRAVIHTAVAKPRPSFP